MKSSLRSRLTYSVLAAVILFLISVAGYILIEKFHPLDAIYMTIITLSTVGFGEIRPLTIPGRIFTSGIIVTGVIIIAVLFSVLTEYIVAGELAGTLKARRVMKKIKTLRGHYIVCGIGKVGENVAIELKNQGLMCVVIDKDKNVIEKVEQLGLLGIVGDATIDDVLIHAGIDNATGLVAAMNSDTDNLFLVLSARTLNPSLKIVARSAREETASKLRLAGADRIVSPYNMAGYRIVNQLIRPHVTFFLDIAMRNMGLNLLMDEIEIANESPLAHQRMSDAAIRTKTGANVITILRGDQHEIMEWSLELTFEPGDTLIVVGKTDELRALAKLAGDTRFDG